MALLGKEQLLFENNPQPMWVFDLDTLAFLAVNQAAIVMYGYSKDEFLRMTTKDIRPAEDVPDLLRSIRNGTEGLRGAGTWRHLTKDGTLILAEIVTHDIEWDGRQARLVAATNVTKRKQAEDELRAERELLRTLIDNVPDLIYVKDAASRFVVANRAVTRLAGGKTPEDLVGKTDFDFFPKDLATSYFSDEQAIIQSGQALVGRREASVDAEGNSRWLSTSKVPWRDPHGQTIGIIGIGRDITKRKQAEDELRAERGLLRTLIDNMPDYIYVKDAQSRFLIANSALAKLIGVKSSEDLLGKSDFDFFPKELAASFYADEQAVIRSGEPLVNREEPSVDAQGNAKWTLTSKVPLHDPRGQTIGIIGIGRDITERKQAGDALRESNQALKALVDASPVGIVCVDRSWNVTLWNPTAERIFGWSEKELLGRPFSFVPDDMRKTYNDLRAAVFQGETVSNREMRARRKDRSQVDVLLSMAPLRDGLGEIRGAMDIVVDLTSSQKAETQLRLQAAALESSANAVAITDRPGNIIWVNPAFTVMTGYSAEEVIGKSFHVLNSGTQPKSFYEQLWQTILGGNIWHGEIVNRRKDGSLYTEDQTITPVRNQRGETSHFVATMQDISEKKALAQQLNQAQKMESVGRLAGGVAHDFNNLLSVIIGYSDVLLDRPGLDPAMHKQAEEIRKAGKRAASLTRQLLAFSRQQVLEPKVLNLNAIVTDIEKMLRRLIGEDVELQSKLDPALGSVKADPGQIEQIIVNLAVNARDAMPQGGKLFIETCTEELDEEYARRHPPCTPGRYVLLSVTDTGIGMDPETQAHIFEPFFTTKELGKGTGLGLSTVYGIVKQSGGYIWVYSEPGHGAMFKIYLPQVGEPAQAIHPSEPASAQLLGSETILVVEDEESLRTLTHTLLEHRGYTVLDAKEGTHAFQVAQQHSGPIHLLLTDVVMPGMDGPKVAAQITQLHPETKVLYMSGYTGFSATGSGLLEVGMHLLQKPFTRDALLRKVREVLESQVEVKTS